MSEQTFFQRLSNNLLYSAQPFVMINYLAAVIFFAVRIAELVSVRHVIGSESSFIGILVSALLLDVLVLSLFMFILSLIYHLLRRFAGQTAAVWVHTVLLFILLLVSAGLSRYYSITLLPLGTDFFGYSWSDIIETVIASGGIDLLTVLAIAVLGGIIFSLPMMARRLPAPKFLVNGFYLSAVLSIPLLWGFAPSPADFRNESEFTAVENKLFHFAGGSIRYAAGKLVGDAGDSGAEYPFLHEDAEPDVLGKFMTLNKAKPNIVIIIVEGLGRSFVTGGSYQGFTPFFDSLSAHGLFWRNFLSTTGRTFGVLPSLTASLPFAEKGFMELGERMPEHHSLFTLLQQNGYRTSYFYGGKINFDMQNIFLERQNISAIIDAGDFPSSYEKAPPNESGFSWGYADDDLFKRSLQEIEERNFTPRLDVYMTLTTHEPFVPPNAERYRQEFEQRLKGMELSEDERNGFREYKDIFSSLLYTDAALRNFFNACRKRSDYANTIFIITGDHRLIPVPMDSKIDRYRVPFLIYSPMLKNGAEFSSVSTHSDVPPTLVGFLRKNYPMIFPKQNHWIGTVIDTAREFRVNRSRAFMPFKGEISDYLSGRYFLSGERLFKVNNGLNIEEIRNDSIRDHLAALRGDFISQSSYAVAMDRIYPHERRRTEERDGMNDDSLFAWIDRRALNSDQLFIMARDTAFKKYYAEARVICRRLLAINPDYHDVRMLLGRTYAWDHQYLEASDAFTEVIRRSPSYADAFFGLAQVQFWSGNFEEGLKTVNKAIDMLPSNMEARFLRATILNELGRSSEALTEVETVLKQMPAMEDARLLKKKIILTKR